MTRPVLEAWRSGKFQVLMSEALLAELEEVSQRSRLRRHIDKEDVQDLLDRLRWSAEFVEPITIPPHCRDPKDHPFLATAIDGQADAIVSGDSDLRGDDQLREEMKSYGVELWGVETLLAQVENPRIADD